MERGHRFRRFSVGCLEFAVLVNRLRTADSSEVARCLELIESLADALRKADGDEADCEKRLVKLWLFAARIAGGAFPRQSHQISLLGEVPHSASTDAVELRQPSRGDGTSLRTCLGLPARALL